MSVTPTTARDMCLEQIGNMARTMAAMLDDATVIERLAATQSATPVRHAMGNLATVTAEVREIAWLYARKRISSQRHTLRDLSVYEIDSETLRREAVNFILWRMVEAHVTALPEQLPKIHHWLPVCYVRRFTAGGVRPARRGSVMVSAAYFNKEGQITASSYVRDPHFAHKAQHSRGFYNPHTEMFFGKVETAYGEVVSSSMSKPPSMKKRVNNAYTLVAAYAFFIVQSMRNPVSFDDGVAIFANNRKNSIFMDGIFDRADELLAPNARVIHTTENLWFSPYFPPRTRVTAEGVRVHVFPMASSMALVVSDSRLSSSEARRVVDENNISMMRAAARHGHVLYGADTGVIVDERTGR